MSSDSDDIRRYHDGSMTAAERHALEKRALSDPFLADALEGAETISEAEFSSDIEALTRKIRPEENPVFAPLRIAAGIILILTVGSLGYYLNQNEEIQLASNKGEGSATNDTVQAAVKPDTVGSAIALAKDAVKPEEKVTARQPGKAAEGQEAKASTQPATTGPLTTSAPAAQTEIATKTDAPPEQVIAADQKTETVVARAMEEEAAKKEAVDDSRDKVTFMQRKAMATPSSSELKSIGPLQRIVKGTVTTAEEGAPLPGVNIQIQGTTQGTVTDLHGNYSISLPIDEVTLSYSFIGMETKQAKPGTQSTLNVSMNPDAVQLSEVVLVGQAQTRDEFDELNKPVIRLAAPVGGIKAYNKYLESSLRYPPEAREKKIKGKVTITFTVTTTGSLTDFNVVRSLGYGCDDEVVRLVKEGPSWSPSTENDVPVESEVRVKLKFDPEKGFK